MVLNKKFGFARVISTTKSNIVTSEKLKFNKKQGAELFSKRLFNLDDTSQFQNMNTIPLQKR